MNLYSKLKMNWPLIWSLDVNALAVTRIGLGLILLFDLVGRFYQVDILYGANAMAPAELVDGTFPAIWRLYFLNDDLRFTKVLIGLTVAFAFLWTVGFKGKLTMVLTWFLYASLFYRNSLIHSGAEPTLLAAMFWMMWLPHSAVFSVDAILNPRTESIAQRFSHYSPASVAFISQVVIYYLFSGLNKYDPIWWQEGSALYYALNLDNLVSDSGLWLLNHPLATQILSIATWWLELLAPVLLLLCPLLFGRSWRTVAVFALIGLHLGIAIFLNIGNFPFINIVILIALLPLSSSATILKDVASNTINCPRHTILLAAALALLSSQIVYSTLRFQNKKPPSLLRYVLLVTTTDNSYRFFAPHPPLNERFWFFPGTLENGKMVNVYDLSLEPVVIDKSIAIAKWNRFHLKYFSHFDRPNRYSKKLRAQFAQFLCQRWQSQTDLPSLTSVNLRYQIEWTSEWYKNTPDFVYTSRGHSYKCKKRSR